MDVRDMICAYVDVGTEIRVRTRVACARARVGWTRRGPSPPSTRPLQAAAAPHGPQRAAHILPHIVLGELGWWRGRGCMRSRRCASCCSLLVAIEPCTGIAYTQSPSAYALMPAAYTVAYARPPAAYTAAYARPSAAYA